ncbi:MAG: excalibur calcium-binding domain-containing protein [Anaerolineae bacterium]|nr:excalibur calcium-binding domain-containing protein [Anaerolineae bacterium]
MKVAHLPKTGFLLGGLFLFCLVAVGGMGHGRSLQACDVTPTLANFLPFVVRDTTPVPPVLPTNTPVTPPQPTVPGGATAVPTATHPAPSGCSICSFNAYNCSDFQAQDSAQACHDYCFTLVGYDVHRLDADNDGLACESLP